MKSGIDFWKCDLEEPDDDEKRKFDVFISEQESNEIEIVERSFSEDTTEVSHFIAGYVTKKNLVRSKCEDCAPLMVNHTYPNNKDYLNILSRGGLIYPSLEHALLFASAFAQIDLIDKFINLSILIN